MKDVNIGFVGGGNMARSLIGGLIADGVPAERLWVSDPDAQTRRTLEADFGVRTCADNRSVAEAVQVLVLAVKPQVLQPVARDLGETIAHRGPLVISIAAGVREPDLCRWLGGTPAVVRAMPNTPALVRSAASALYANPQVSPQQRELAEAVMRAVGMVLWLDKEADMDAVTALSGSGPAYFFLLMEALEQAGTALGLSRETARLLTLETAFGAAKMALESSEDAATLRARVTSPGGTTEQAIAVLQAGGLPELVARAVAAAQTRSRELAVLLGGNNAE